MTDERFWAIADEYEMRDKNLQSYVPKENIPDLCKAIVTANKGDTAECRADLTLFRFKNHTAYAKEELELQLNKGDGKDE